MEECCGVWLGLTLTDSLSSPPLYPSPNPSASRASHVAWAVVWAAPLERGLSHEPLWAEMFLVAIVTALLIYYFY
jgi:hypothetical protein